MARRPKSRALKMFSAGIFRHPTLLARYRAQPTNIPPSDSPSHQESISSDRPANVPMKKRHSPGETDKHVDYILSRGGTHSITSLVMRLKEVLGIDHSDSTIGVVLRRGLEKGKYKRDGHQWSMVLNQNQPSHQSDEALIRSNEQRSGNAEDTLLLMSRRVGAFEESGK
jgi:hypothetical protein